MNKKLSYFFNEERRATYGEFLLVWNNEERSFDEKNYIRNDHLIDEENTYAFYNKEVFNTVPKVFPDSLGASSDLVIPGYQNEL